MYGGAGGGWPMGGYGGDAGGGSSFGGGFGGGGTFGGGGAFGGAGGVLSNLLSLYGQGFGSTYGNLFGGGGGQGGMGGIGNWLSSLWGGGQGQNPAASMGGQNQMLYPGGTGPVPIRSTASQYPGGVEPPGTMMLTPGGTPETAKDVSGQPIPPSYWDATRAGLQGGATKGTGLPSGGGKGAKNDALAALQQLLSEQWGLGPDAIDATMRALQAAAARRQAILGGQL